MEKLKKPSSNEFRSRQLNLVLGRCKRDQFSSSVLKWVWEEWKGRFRVLATPYEQSCFVVSPEWNRLWVVRLTSHWAGRLFLHPAIITGEMGSLKVEPSSAGAPAKYQVGRPVLPPPRWSTWVTCFSCTYLSRVLVYVNVNDSAVFVALLNDIILDLVRPAGIIFSEKQRLNFYLKPLRVRLRKKKNHSKYQGAQLAEKDESSAVLRLWVEKVGQLKAVSGQGLWRQVQSLAWSRSRDSCWQRKMSVSFLFF